MLELDMLRKINILILYTFLATGLCAKEHLLAILNTAVSNEIQKFGIGNYTFECRAYGVVVLETLYNSSKVGSRCQKSIDKFYIKNPKLKYYVDSILKYKQKYHIEIKNRECIIYANSQITLSELLLKEGLALKKPKFKDEEFYFYFSLAQRKAKIEKKGLWNEKILTNCIEELNK
jgi:hypothetical protein